MDKIREWLKGRTVQAPATGLAQAPRPDVEDRESRADRIVALRAEVSRLQQEIVVLNTASEGAAAKQSKMLVLERELRTAQRELAKIQGRV